MAAGQPIATDTNQELQVSNMHFDGYKIQVETKGNFSTLSAYSRGRLPGESVPDETLKVFWFTFLRDLLNRFETNYRVKIMQHEVFSATRDYPIRILINHQKIATAN